MGQYVMDKNLFKSLEYGGFYITEMDNKRGRKYYEVSSYTRCGAEITFNVDDISKKKLNEAVDSLDVDQEVLENIKYVDLRGALSLRDALGDMEEWKDRLKTLVNIPWMEKYNIGSKVMAALNTHYTRGEVEVLHDIIMNENRTVDDIEKIISGFNTSKLQK